MKRMKTFLIAAMNAAIPALFPISQAAPEIVWNVEVGGTGPEVKPTMHGVFFEDINYGGDGGLYAELVENRSFEHRTGMFAWSEEKRGACSGASSLETDKAVHSNNPRYLRLKIAKADDGYGISNLGYGGIPVKGGESYRFSLHARGAENYTGGLKVRVESVGGRVLAEGRIDKLTPSWQRYKCELTASDTDNGAKLVLLADSAGVVDLDVISLFPKNTFKGRENGMRADLAKLIADMKPGFMRFPGGCIVEGKNLGNAYHWKDTVGPIWERKQNWNRWQEVMAKSNVSEYSQTYGLGFFEFFQLCEDVGASPVPVINCGMSCQFQDKELVPMKELDPWVQDALDLVEFANGPATSKWGKLRADMGHPEPFGMTHMGVGNEQWGEEYFKRYLVFQKALKAKYPELTLITTSGPGVDDASWKLAWDKFKSGVPAEIVDEHYYRPLNWFLDQASRYDAYDRKGPKVFAGEFAAHRKDKANALDSAVCEAAFMTGLMRNADIVTMSCYAPMLAREGFVQWAPDMIWFDATRAMATPNYHVQAMFSANRPDHMLPTTFSNNQARGVGRGKAGVGTWLTQAEFKDVVVKDAGNKILFRSDKNMEGFDKRTGTWKLEEGALRQSSGEEGAIALIGDGTWKDGSISLKARKLGGSEGFLVLFQSADEKERCWWNIGGWGNTAHGLEVHGAEIARAPGRIESKRWYDIRIELKGSEISCFLDNKLIHKVTQSLRPSIYASAGIDRKAGEVILQVANPGHEARQLSIHLRGWKSAKPAKGQLLTSASPDDKNTLEKPDLVSPKDVTSPVNAGVIHQTLPPWSHTTLRVPR